MWFCALFFSLSDTNTFTLWSLTPRHNFSKTSQKPVDSPFDSCLYTLLVSFTEASPKKRSFCLSAENKQVSLCRKPFWCKAKLRVFAKQFQTYLQHTCIFIFFELIRFLYVTVTPVKVSPKIRKWPTLGHTENVAKMLRIC